MDYQTAKTEASVGRGVKLPEHPDFRYFDEHGSWVNEDGYPTKALTKLDERRKDWEVEIILHAVSDVDGVSCLFLNKPIPDYVFDESWGNSDETGVIQLPGKNLFSKIKPEKFILVRKNERKKRKSVGRSR